jgi:hypothetical protein
MVLPANRKEIVEFSKVLKQRLSTEYGMNFRVHVVKQVSPNPWIQLSTTDYPNTKMPNELRKQAMRVIGSTPLNWEDISYGNVRDSGISLYYVQWKSLLGDV